jgi:D-sedoheptulose 7-phosphate isomerase
MEESCRLRRTTLDDCDGLIEAAAAGMAERFRHGGRLFAFGNGGSATDADGTVALFQDPPAGRPLPARSLVADPAVLTALANDVGYDLVFSRQIIAHARPGDIAIGFSTSGGSVNVIQAFEEASRRQLLTIGLCGYDGGAMAGSAALDYCLVVRSASVHRIQEAQDAVALALWRAVQRHLGEVLAR